jgi:ribosomal protein L44E
MKTLEPNKPHRVKLIVRCTSCEKEHDAGKVKVIKTLTQVIRSNRICGGDLISYSCPSCKRETTSLVLGAKVSHYS